MEFVLPFKHCQPALNYCLRINSRQINLSQLLSFLVPLHHLGTRRCPLVYEHVTCASIGYNFIWLFLSWIYPSTLCISKLDVFKNLMSYGCKTHDLELVQKKCSQAVYDMTSGFGIHPFNSCPKLSSFYVAHRLVLVSKQGCFHTKYYIRDFLNSHVT